MSLTKDVAVHRQDLKVEDLSEFLGYEQRINTLIQQGCAHVTLPINSNASFAMLNALTLTYQALGYSVYQESNAGKGRTLHIV